MPKHVLVINLAFKIELFQIDLENLTADFCN